MENQTQFVNSNKENTVAGFFVPKGINHARIKKSAGGVDKIYHIFNTHFEVSVKPKIHSGGRPKFVVL